MLLVSMPRARTVTYDVHCSRKRVARLMREAVRWWVSQRKRGGTKRGIQRAPLPDALSLNTRSWLYLAVVIVRLCSQSSVGQWRLTRVEMALWNRQPFPGRLARSTLPWLGQRLEQAHILGSMGTVGDALDNAVAESFFATLQVELLDRQRSANSSLRPSLITRSSSTASVSTRPWAISVRSSRRCMLSSRRRDRQVLNLLLNRVNSIGNPCT